MDIDRYTQRHDPTWRRLQQLADRARSTRRRVDDDEIAELVSLYQRVSAQLSHARTTYADPALNARLSQLLGEARVVIYRRRSNPARAVATFATRTFPAAVWFSRRFIAVAALAFLVPAFAFGIWLAHSPQVLDASIPPELQQVIAQKEFADYYRSDAAQNFAGQVTVNNAFVAFLTFALGVVPVLGPVSVLFNNGLNVGVMGAVMHHAGEGPQFWGLILPHGLLEIASILVAGGAGLQLSWAMIAPGDRTRAAALKDAGLRSVVIVIGLVVCFVVAGFIEGFVTPSELPTAMRIGIGVSVLALFVAYIVGFGRQAVCDGATGLFGEESPGRRTPSQFDTDRPDPADSPAEPGTEPLRTTTA
ncbi:MAG TPA: stage II sporulation protein M [Microthrixaceae bacterium]|nr:stage II sporulation protein M [Microthrixaceae bacterium]HMY88302.1 stage II sporulation protein M [Microthrixaceae bacterium]HNB95277.1 stage II sporulation protein M [Microthrixaceae bacterium]